MRVYRQPHAALGVLARPPKHVVAHRGVGLGACGDCRHGRHLVNVCATLALEEGWTLREFDEGLIKFLECQSFLQRMQWRIEELISGLAGIDHGRHLANTCSTLAQAAG